MLTYGSANTRGDTILTAINHPHADIFRNEIPATLLLCLMHQDLVPKAAEHGLSYLSNEVLKESSLHWHKICSGIVSEWSYAGTPFSFFPLHLEDSKMPSANLVVAGKPKIWLFITEPNLRKLNTKLEGIVEDHITASKYVPANALPLLRYI
jgi:hypothetical protein